MVLLRIVWMLHIVVREVHPLLLGVQLFKLLVDVLLTLDEVEEQICVSEPELDICKTKKNIMHQNQFI